MVEVIFHIGMGKTGTSSIQAALNINKNDLLENQKVKYLGMWFEIISKEFFGYEGQKKFFTLPEEEIKKCAEIFFNALKESAGKEVEKYILSNEAIYGFPDRFGAFCNALSKFCDVSVICYARDPIDWLPSAYVQWGVYHKANKGNIISFKDYARRQVKSYAAILRWRSILVGPTFNLRQYTKGSDVVADFAKACNIDFQHRPPRVLERVKPAEVVLRAAYNNLFDDEVLPSEFNSAFALSNCQLFSLKRVLEDSLDYSSVNDVVHEQVKLFNRIRDEFGLDIRKENLDAKDGFSEGKLREEIFDFIIHQTAFHAKILKDYRQRLDDLEDQVARMTAEMRSCSKER